MMLLLSFYIMYLDIMVIVRVIFTFHMTLSLSLYVM